MRARAAAPLALAGLLLVGACGGEDPTVAASPAGGAGSTGGAPTPASASAPATSAGTPSRPAPCGVPDLQVTLGERSGAAGSTYVPVVFRNTSGATCRLDGHPGVSFVAGDDGHQVGAAATRELGPAPVALPPGESAHATLQITSAGNYPEADCRPTPARGLRVYPPDSTASVFVAAELTACASESVELLHVRPVEPGAS